MAWETRNGGGRYYTRNKRLNGRVVREYIGTGPVAELIAAHDAERRAEREEERATRNGRKDELERIAALVDRCWSNASTLAAATLVGAGFYRHHRGKWRKRRVS